MTVSILRSMQRYLQQLTSFRQSKFPIEHQYHRIACLFHSAILGESSQLCNGSSFPCNPGWYHLIRNNIYKGLFREAFDVYKLSRYDGVYELSVVPLLLKACTSLSFYHIVKALHAESIKVGSYIDIMIGTTLLGVYAKCGLLQDSRQVFETMPERNVVTWNAMINEYLRIGDVGSASLLFDKMPERTEVTWNQMINGIARSGDTVSARQMFDKVPHELKNVVTWTVMVDVYARNGEMEAAREIFEQMPRRNFFVWSSMICGYCKKGNVKEAKAIFDQILVRNLEIWNSMISGYVHNGFGEEALQTFHEMVTEGFEPDEYTIASVLSACAQLGSLDAGKAIHHVIKHKGIKMNQFVVSALVDMYAKCGDLINARMIFEEFTERNIYCWNAIISGFAINGKCQEVLQLFRRMEDSSVTPDGITFVTVLSACAHGGLIGEALQVMSEMETYGLKIDVKHYGCVIDLLGRAGRLKEAYELMKRMLVKPNCTVLGAMLGACRIHSDMKMAEQVMQDIRAQSLCTEVGEDSLSYHVLLSNIYSAAERWEEAERMRMVMVNEGSQKIPGFSSVIESGSDHQLCAATK